MHGGKGFVFGFYVVWHALVYSLEMGWMYFAPNGGRLGTEAEAEGVAASSH